MVKRSTLEKFGCHRALEPLHAFPGPAWKLDNSPEIRDHEILVDVRIINVNSTSFSQIYNAANGDPHAMTQRILEIIRVRGKLQNPVTGTGGILYGRVAALGRAYPNPAGLKKGDAVITLASLSLTPLTVQAIHRIDIHSGQLHVEGKAVLFSHMPLVRVAPGRAEYPLELMISVMDEAGAPHQTWHLAKPGQEILIMGAHGKLGLLCAYGAREKIGARGRITGIVRTPQSRKQLLSYPIYDEVLCCDALDTVGAIEKLAPGACQEFDLTVNCMTASGSEMLSLILTRAHGTLFFASLANSQKITALTSESMGKPMDIIGYTGFLDGHAGFTEQLVTGHPDLIDLLNRLYRRQTRRAARPDRTGKEIRELGHLLKDQGRDYVFVSEEIRAALASAVRVARYDCTALITGESGVGKEIIADMIHRVSERNSQPMVKINCGTIPDTLLESELFGYEKGAFTGAREKGKKGFFELAHNGTLFLDEVGELKLELQAKILRAIQEKQIYRLGGTRPVPVNVRIIAATNRSLEAEIRSGQFREDLFYRLNVYPIPIPPLRERRRDIIPLIDHFIAKYNAKFGMDKHMDPVAVAHLADYDWPGNIRELENLVQRILIKAGGEAISLADTMAELPSPGLDDQDRSILRHGFNLRAVLDQAEFKLLSLARQHHPSTRKMAQALGLSQTTLVRKLKKHGL